MRYSPNRLLLIACLLLLAAAPDGSPAQPPTPSPASQQTPADPQPTPDQTFPAKITKGPLLPPQIPDPDTAAKAPLSVQGPVWDGTNNGLWIILHSDTAILLDPISGQPTKRITVPPSQLIAHDGVGLWLAIPSQAGPTYRRVRTAPDHSPSHDDAHRPLPPDSPTDIALHTLRITPAVPAATSSSLFLLTAADHTAATFRLFRCYFDLGTANLYGHLHAQHQRQPSLTSGAGYLWILDSSLTRIPLSALKPADLAAPSLAHLTQADKFPLTAPTQLAALDPRAVPLTGSITWDGRQLWSFTTDKLAPATETQPSPLAHTAPSHLVSIDVGFTRHPDTDARYRKALAFEAANGTAKALPLFEQIFTDDPSAAEVRNHVAWALATRPNEPYHNLDRALELVNQALLWQPWNPEMWDTLAEIHWRKKNADLALRLEARAINLNPNKAFYWRQYDKFLAGPTSQEAPEPEY